MSPSSGRLSSCWPPVPVADLRRRPEGQAATRPHARTCAHAGRSRKLAPWPSAQVSCLLISGRLPGRLPEWPSAQVRAVFKHPDGSDTPLAVKLTRSAWGGAWPWLWEAVHSECVPPAGAP